MSAASNREARNMVWYVALGGAIGSVARYLVGLTVQSRSGLDFPIGTLLVNLTGCLLLGFLARCLLETSAVSPESAPG
jgi:fluoride exporter